MHRNLIVLSFNGKTTDFDSVYGGSTPSGTAKNISKIDF